MRRKLILILLGLGLLGLGAALAVVVQMRDRPSDHLDTVLDDVTLATPTQPPPEPPPPPPPPTATTQPPPAPKPKPPKPRPEPIAEGRCWHQFGGNAAANALASGDQARAPDEGRVGAGAEELHGVPAELLRRADLRQHRRRRHVGARRDDGQDDLDAAVACAQAVHARDRRQARDRDRARRERDRVPRGERAQLWQLRVANAKVESSPLVVGAASTSAPRTAGCSRSTSATATSAGRTTPAGGSTPARRSGATASSSRRTRARSSRSGGRTESGSGGRTSAVTRSATRASTPARRRTASASTRSRAPARSWPSRPCPGRSSGRATRPASGYSTPAVANGRVFVGGFDGALHAYRSTTGRRLWSRYVGGRVLGAPFVVGDLVFFATLESHTYAVSTSTASGLAGEARQVLARDRHGEPLLPLAQRAARRVRGANSAKKRRTAGARLEERRVAPRPERRALDERRARTPGAAPQGVRGAGARPDGAPALARRRVAELRQQVAGDGVERRLSAGGSSCRQSRSPGVGGRARFCWCGFALRSTWPAYSSMPGSQGRPAKSQMRRSSAPGVGDEPLVAHLEVAVGRRAAERAGGLDLGAPLAGEAGGIGVRPRPRRDPLRHRPEGDRRVAPVADQVDEARVREEPLEQRQVLHVHRRLVAPPGLPAPAAYAS